MMGLSSVQFSSPTFRWCWVIKHFTPTTQ